MSKKSILTLIFTLILAFSLQAMVIAEKDSDDKKTSSKTEKIEEKKAEIEAMKAKLKRISAED